MKIRPSLPGLKGFRYPRDIISYVVWAYHRFAMSMADVKDLLAERGVIVSRETVRLWVHCFGRPFADCIRRNRLRPSDKWHLDGVLITISGKRLWLWRAIDARGDVLEILVQTHRNRKTARQFFQSLIAQFGKLRVVITDMLRSYIKPIKALAPNADHRAHKGLNNAITRITSTDAETRKGFRTVQIPPAGPKIFVYARPKQPYLPSLRPSTQRSLISPH